MNTLRSFFIGNVKSLNRHRASIRAGGVVTNMAFNHHNGTGNGHREHVDIVSRFVKVGNVYTHLSQMGQVAPGDPDAGTSRFLILIIPGNPGVPTYYEDFMRELYDQSGGQIPVWAIGHAGHTRPPNRTLSLKDIVDTDENTYGLQAQIDHKVTFIKEHIPSDVKLILIGHSIGCYFILNLLEKISSHYIHRCFMLFPTLERMAISPNGVNLTPILHHFRWIVILLAFLCILLPQSVRRTLIRFIYRKVDHPACMPPAIMSTITPWTVNFCTFLAKMEMEMVTNLQKDLVRKHMDKLSIYYGTSDLWCPIQYYKDMVEEFPSLDARLCELDLKHAFVMVRTQGQQMAELLWQWMHKHDAPKSFTNGVAVTGIRAREE